MEKSKIAKASVSYTIGNYFIKGINLITTPIFARLMTTSDYGVYNTFTAYESILYIFICLALHSSLKNAYYKFENKMNEYTSSVVMIPIAMAGMMMLLTFVFQKELCQMLELSFPLLCLLVVYSYFSGVLIFYRHRIALDYKSREYLMISLYNVFCSIIVSIVLMLTMFSDEKYIGRIIGGVAAYASLGIYILAKIWRKAHFNFNSEYWKYGLKISIPLIPHGLAQIFLLQFDRIMIHKMVGSAEAGIYSFSYTLYSFVQITATSLDTAFSPWVFRQLKDHKISDVKRVATCFMIFLAGISTMGMLLSPEIILIIGGMKYSEAVYTTIPIILAGFFAMAYTIPAVIEYYYEKTQYISIGTGIAALINVILNYLCIRQFGYISAAYTTLISYLVYYIIHTIISRKLSGFFIINMKKLIVCIMVIVIGFSVSIIFMNALIIRLFVAGILITIGSMILIGEYGFDKVKTIVREFRK